MREEIAQRRQLERESTRNPLAITTHRRNYIFPISYNAKPNKPAFANISSDNGPRDVEVKFQFSAKVNLIEDLFGDTGDLYFAFTQRSWWQAYNTDASSPFRETNYEPEVFINFDNAWRAFGWTNVRNRVALNHLSNGRSEPLSRSWNRVYLESMFQRGDWGSASRRTGESPNRRTRTTTPISTASWAMGISPSRDASTVTRKPA